MANEASSLQALLVSSAKNYRLPTYEYKPFLWRQIGPVDPDLGPGPRSGHRMIYHDRGVVIYGGFNPRTEIKEFREVWRYSVGREEWNLKKITGDVTKNVASLAATVINDNATATSPLAKMLVYGGTSHPFGTIRSIKVFLCDLKTFNWEVVRAVTPDGLPSDPETSEEDVSDDEDLEDDFNKPRPLYGQAIAVIKNNLYTVGGTNGHSYKMDVDRFSFETRIWKKLYRSSLFRGPMPRYRHEICVHDGKIIVIGGGTSFSVLDLIELWCFDTKLKHPQEGDEGWTKITTLPDLGVIRSERGNEQFPKPRKCHEIVQHGKYAYVFGGYDAEDVMSDTWRLDLETFQWKLLPYPMKEAVYFSSSAVSPSGQVFQMGGVKNVETSERSNRLHSMWVGVTSLRDMAWESVLHYLPAIFKVSEETLTAGGIPVDLLNSLRPCCSC